MDSYLHTLLKGIFIYYIMYTNFFPCFYLKQYNIIRSALLHYILH